MLLLPDSSICPHYEKVVYHAGKVLGNNPLSVLRDWTTIYDNSDEETYAYIKETEVG